MFRKCRCKSMANGLGIVAKDLPFLSTISFDKDDLPSPSWEAVFGSVCCHCHVNEYHMYMCELMSMNAGYLM